MINKIAAVTSYIFHPIFFFLYIFLYLLFFSDILIGILYRYNISLIIIYILGNSIIIPLIIIYFLRRDIYLADKKKRTVPYIIIIVSYIFIYFFLKRYSLPDVIMRFLLSTIIIIVILSILNLLSKISIHTTSSGAALALFLKLTLTNPYDFFYPLMFIFIICGLIGTSRFILKAHSSFEVYSGYILGTCITFLILSI